MSIADHSAHSRRFKERAFEQLALVGKGLSSPRRLELLDVLLQGPRTVEDLASQASMSVASASQHLRVLRAAGLVDAEKRGLYVTYRVSDTEVGALYVQLRAVAERQLPALAQLTRAQRAAADTATDTAADTATDSLEQLDSDELLRRALAGEVTVLDVRAPSEYAAAHLPTARSVPLSELEQVLAELPRDREVIAYCRGPFCVLAQQAVARLRASGFTAHHLQQGPVDWRAAGVPLACA